MLPFGLDLTTILLSLTVGFVVWYLYRSQARDARWPPWPHRPLPLIGHLSTVFDKDSHLRFTKELGSIYCLKLGPQMFVFLNDYEHIREALVKRGDDFSDKEHSVFDQEMNEINLGIIASSGPHWKENRTASINILRSLGMGKNVLACKIQEEVDILVKFLGNLGSEPRDIRSTVSKSVANVTCAILLGERFDYEDPTFSKIMEMLNHNIATFANPRLLWVHLFNGLIKLPGDFFCAKQIISNMRNIRTLFIQHFKAKRGEEALKDESNVDNFVAAYMNEQRKREAKGEPTCMTDANLERTMDDLLLAGAETTGTTLNWALSFASKHPEVLEKIHLELDREVGRNRHPTMQDRPQLPYLNAFIMEAQRYANIVPMGVSHLVPKDAWLNGYLIPARSCLMFNMTSIFFDKKTWGDDADQFRPERFLDEAGNVRNVDELIPFSIGRRACPGEALAKMSLFLYLANLFQKFTFINPDPTMEIEKIIGLTTSPGPYKLKIVSRE